MLMQFIKLASTKTTNSVIKSTKLRISKTKNNLIIFL